MDRRISDPPASTLHEFAGDPARISSLVLYNDGLFSTVRFNKAIVGMSVSGRLSFGRLT